MFGRTRFQQGSLQQEKRRAGSAVWIFRWYEAGANGKRQRRYRVIGTVEEYPTEAAAQMAAAALRLDINTQTPRAPGKTVTVGELITHYEEKELDLETPGPADEDEHEKAYATKQIYRIVLERWIRPRWGRMRIEEVRTVAVEQWLRGLMKEPRRAKEGVKPRPPERLARSTKAKIRNIMHALFNHAVRYDWVKQQANPITRVRQSAKRERIPEVLEIAEFQALLAELTLRDRVLVILDAITGLRRSELAGLKWGDIDFENLEISVTRSVVSQVVGRCKTEASRKPVPLESSVADDLWLWKQTTPYSRPEDWVFASVIKKGKQPLWLDTLLKKNIQPAAKRAGIKKRVGWHTFRHNYSTLLKANGEDIKTVQELLRHANSKITMDTYTQALSPAKRQAQSKVANLILPKKDAGEKG